MITWKVGKEKIKLPDGWHDVSYNDAMYVIENDLPRLKALSHISGKDLSKYSLDGNAQTLFNSYQFLNSLEVGEPDLPKIFTLNDVTRSVHLGHFDDEESFGEVSVGQIEDMVTEIQNYAISIDGELTELDLLKLYPRLIAIYVDPILSLRDYDYNTSQKRVEDIKEQFDFKTVSKMGAFFFAKSINYGNGQNKTQSKLILRIKKFKRALWKFLRNGGFMRPWTWYVNMRVNRRKQY